jgi:hypothetical protein
MHRDRGGSIVHTLFQLGLVVLASKSWVDGLSGFGLKTQGWISRQQMASLESSRQGEATS